MESKIKNNIFKYWAGVLSVIILLSVCSCSDNTKQTEVEAVPSDSTDQTDIITITAEQQKAANIKLGSAIYVDIATEVKATGVIDVPPSNLATVSSFYGGYVSLVTIYPGQFVSKGSLLCILQHPDYVTMQQDYLDAEARLNAAASELSRQNDLIKEDVGAKKRQEAALSESNSLKARLAALKSKLKSIGINTAKLSPETLSDKITIKAPISGYVKTVNINLGKYVAPADVMFQIVDKDHMHVELHVFESDALAILPNQTFDFVVGNTSTTHYQGEVYLVGKTLDLENRTVNIHGHMHPEVPSLMPGMYVSATIKTGSKKMLVIPNTALALRGKDYFIYVSTNKPLQYKRVAVEVLQSENNLNVINADKNLLLSGRIVLDGAFHLEGAAAISGSED